MKLYQAQPGHELRGMTIRIYPTEEQERIFEEISEPLRRSWNQLVARSKQVSQARTAYAQRHNLVGPRPTPPVNEAASKERKAAWKAYKEAWKEYQTKRKTMSRKDLGPPPVKPEGAQESEATKAQWAAYRKECKEWHHAVYLATKDLPCCAWRPKLSEEVERFGLKHGYQLLIHLMKADDEFYGINRQRKPNAHAFQALLKNFFSGRAKDGKGLAKGQRQKQFKREWDPMPIQVKSGTCFKMGNFGDRRGKPFYNCQITINGMKIKGRLPGRIPWGRVLEGVSITKQADGWWASILQEVPLRVLPEPIPGTVVGIDVGLYVIAAFGLKQTQGDIADANNLDGKMIVNPRGKEFAERIAGRQAQKLYVGRLHQQAARQVTHLIYNEIVKPLERVEIIRVEKLPPKIGHMGSDMYSVMRKVIRILKERYEYRVQERNPCYTSQLCSGCGHHSKHTWEWRANESPYRVCPKCGSRKHRDHNAACNIALDEDEWRRRLERAGLQMPVEDEAEGSEVQYEICDNAAE